MRHLNLKATTAISFALMISLAACESEPSASPVKTPPKQAKTTAVVNKINKLSPADVELDAADAATVAGIYVNGNSSSRSGSAKTVKNVVTISDSIGNPSIYAVNFEDGYILVSATQKYFPVLAEVEQGTFTIDVLKKTGMEVIVNEMLTNISIARNGDYDFKARTYWRDYVDTGSTQQARLSARSSDDYWEEYDRWWFSDEVYGNNVYYLHECFDNEILPEDVYNNYVSAVQDEDLWEGTDYSWWWTAYVVEKATSTVETHGPLLTTKWHQETPYNVTDKDDLGCVTIAVAQLMKFYRHPTTYYWDGMPDVMYNYTIAPDLTSFLARLRSELNVDDGGGSNIGEAKRVLQSYGYNVTEVDHNDSKIISSLRKKFPVYTEGFDSNTNLGHAWVIDGLEYRTNTTEYVLYRLADSYYPNFHYEEAQCYDKYQEYTSIIRYHYNWGWGGNENGWFLSYEMPTYIIEEIPYKFSESRRELIINSFK